MPFNKEQQKLIDELQVNLDTLHKKFDIDAIKAMLSSEMTVGVLKEHFMNVAKEISKLKYMLLHITIKEGIHNEPGYREERWEESEFYKDLKDYISYKIDEEEDDDESTN